MMVFVGVVGCGSGEGDFVVGRGIGDALLQEAGEIVVEFESKTAALNGEYLKSQIPQIDLAGFADTFQELLVIGAAKGRFAGSQRISVIESDAPLAELSRDGHELREDLGLLLGIEFDVGAGKQRPARRDPEQDFTALMWSLAGAELTERLEGILQAFGCAVETGGAPDIANTDLIAIHGGAEGVAVAGEIFSDADAGIGGDRDGDGILEVAAFGTEELVNLGAFVADGADVGIDRVDYQDDFDGRLAPGDGGERGDGLRGIVIEQSEVLLLQIGDGRARFRGDYYVEVDVATSRLDLRVGLSGGSRRGAEKSDEKKKAKA